jgi:hypothetical protein
LIPELLNANLKLPSSALKFGPQMADIWVTSSGFPA